MAIDLTTNAEAISDSNTLFAGLIVGSPDLPAFPEPPTISIVDPPAFPADLTAEITIPDVEDLTQGSVGGSGVFDKFMSSLNAHIESMYLKGTLSQADVAKVYTAAIESTIGPAAQFLLSQQQSYWAAKLVQMQAQNAWLEQYKLKAELETLKLMAYKAQAEAATAQIQSVTAQTVYANQKLQLVATLQDINSKETTEAIAQAQYDAAYVLTHATLPGGGTVAGSAAKDLELKQKQIDLSDAQIDLIGRQANVQHAQTHDTNIDATPVAGVLGAQKSLYEQQIESYVRDAENKGVKIAADLWTSAKALDDSVQSPGPLSGNLMMALNKYLNNLELPNAMVSADAPATGLPSMDDDWNTPGNQ